MSEAEPVWLVQADILVLHDRLLAAHGGAAGVRDKGLRESALARAKQVAAYGGSVDIIDMAAALTTGITRTHPFVDGNKRTGFVAGILFLELNGFRFTAAEDAAAEAVLGLAAATVDEGSYAAFLRNNAVQTNK